MTKSHATAFPLFLTVILAGLCSIVWMWGAADITPPCGTGLGCSLRTLRLFSVPVRPFQWAPFSLAVPILLIFNPNWTPWLRPMQWAQGFLAVSLQMATFRIVGAVCPYCLGITVLHLTIAASVTWPIPVRPGLLRVGFPLVAALSILAVGYTVWRIETIRTRPIDLARLNALRDIPESLRLGTPTSRRSHWLAIIDPDCPSCDTALSLVAGRREAGDSAEILLFGAGRRHSGAALLQSLQSARTPAAQAFALRDWPRLRRERKEGATNATLDAWVERQLLRTRSLAAQTAPLVLVRNGEGDYRINP